MARVGHHLEERMLGTSDLMRSSRAWPSSARPSARARRLVLTEAGVGLVVGRRLDDDREVVVKLHWWNARPERLTACLPCRPTSTTSACRATPTAAAV
jgi:hypothetical protein